MIITKPSINNRNDIVDLLKNISLFSCDEREVALELLDISFEDKNPNDYLFFATKEDNGLFSSFICFGKTPMTESTYDMYWIGTRDSYQNKGLGKILFNHMKESINNLNGKLIRIETSGQELYTSTQRFYESIGMVKEALIKDFYSTENDLLIYTLRLS